MQQLAKQLSNKLDREEVEKIQKRLENQQLTPEEAREQQEAIFGKVWVGWGCHLDKVGEMVTRDCVFFSIFFSLICA